MFGSDNSILTIAQSMVSHAASRQAVAAENIAQVNTPGFRAKKVADFAQVFAEGEETTPKVDREAAVKPNGNSVSLKEQVLTMASARGQHELGLALWEQTVSMYRTALRGSR
ncbi:MAG: hypothetical protein AAF603_10180 [Pseudomonadota bacterium]